MCAHKNAHACAPSPSEVFFTRCRLSFSLAAVLCRTMPHLTLVFTLYFPTLVYRNCLPSDYEFYTTIRLPFPLPLKFIANVPKHATLGSQPLHHALASRWGHPYEYYSLLPPLVFLHPIPPPSQAVTLTSPPQPSTTLGRAPQELRVCVSVWVRGRLSSTRIQMGIHCLAWWSGQRGDLQGKGEGGGGAEGSGR